MGWGQGNSCKSGDRGAAPSHLSLGSSHLPRLHLGTTEAGVGPCGSPVLKWTCRCRNVNCKAGGLLPPAALPHPRASNPKLCSPLLSPWASQGLPLPRREPLSSHLLVFYLKMNTGCVKCVRRQASRSSSSREPAGGKEGRQTPPEGRGKRGTTGLGGRGGGRCKTGREDAGPARPPARSPRAARRHSRSGGTGAEETGRGSGRRCRCRCRRRHRPNPALPRPQLCPHFRFPTSEPCAAGRAVALGSRPSGRAAE